MEGAPAGDAATDKGYGSSGPSSTATAAAAMAAAAAGAGSSDVNGMKEVWERAMGKGGRTSGASGTLPGLVSAEGRRNGSGPGGGGMWLGGLSG